MPDLTLREALTEYEAECREVSCGYQYHFTRRDQCVLIGCCIMWLAGKMKDASWETFYEHPDEPLRFYLNEVREHMKE